MNRHKKPKRGAVRLLLTLLALIGLGMLAVPFIVVPPSSLEVRLEDDEFHSNLEGKVVRVTDEGGHTRSVTILRRGDGYVAHFGRVPSGKSNWMLEMDHYETAHFSAELKPLKKKTEDVSLRPTFGRVLVKAMNAVKPDRPVHTPLTVTVGEKKYSGDSRQGLTVAPLAPGEYTVKAEAPDYYPVSGKVTVSTGETVKVELYLSPTLGADEAARIVLRWGRRPKDLDAHLLLPEKVNVDHVYYPRANKKAFKDGEMVAMLDVDDTASYGPETTTIYNRLNGRYTYAVYRYSGGGTLGTSEAEVQLYTRDAEVRTFRAPGFCQQRWWYVFDIEVNGSSVRVIDKDECREKMNMMPGKKGEGG